MIIEVKPLKDYKLEITFDQIGKKKVDLGNLLDKPVFRELKNYSYFSQVSNHKYYISWPHEQDLSEDTLLAICE